MAVLANQQGAIQSQVQTSVLKSNLDAQKSAVETGGNRHGIRIDDDTVLPVSRAGRKLLNDLRQNS